MLKKHPTFFWVLLFCFISCNGNLNEGLDFVEESNAAAITTIIAAQDLPVNISNYVLNNFSESAILKIERHQHRTNISYEIQLDSGELLLFTPNGILLALDRDGLSTTEDKDGQEVSASELPIAIINYILSQYQFAVILFAEKENGNEYEIYLDNGIELHFDEAGNLITTERDDDDDGSPSSIDDDDDDDDDDGSNSDNDNDDDDDGSSNDNDDDDDG